MLGLFGFPFCSLALPTYEQLWLIQAADLGGLHLVSAIIATGSGLLLDSWRAFSRTGGFAWSQMKASLITFTAAMILVGTYGGIRLRQIESASQAGPVVAVIQPDIPLTGQEGGDYDSNRLLRELQAMSEEALTADPRPELIVWPEAIGAWRLHNPEYFEQPFARSLFPEIAAADIDLSTDELAARWDAQRAEYRREDAALRAWVRDLGVPLLFGQVHKTPVEQEGELVFAEYNAARLIRPGDGGGPENQLKIRLFPGGEYLPGGRERLRSITGTSEYFTDWVDAMADIEAGKVRERFDLRGSDGEAVSSFVVSICGEILFPESSGVFDHAGGKLVHVTIANEGRFQRNRAQWCTYMCLPFRAIEARRALARSANTGISGFVSPTGRLHGQVTNSKGQYWTGRGFAEQEAIERFEERARVLAENPSDSRLKAELVERAEEIRRLRDEAGISGFSVSRLRIWPHETVYQSIGDAIPRLALLGLVVTSILGCVSKGSKPRVAGGEALDGSRT
jgi:apolipoprotein N-acyltransferase